MIGKRLLLGSSATELKDKLACTLLPVYLSYCLQRTRLTAALMAIAAMG